MNDLVILSQFEEEYLVRSLEAALPVRRMRHFFLWTQGQFQGLLPHQIMVCIHFSDGNEVLRIECMRSQVNDAELIRYLCDPVDGLVVRMAHYCRSSRLLPCVLAEALEDPVLTEFFFEIHQQELANAVVHGTDRLRGGGTFFALFSLPQPPTSRQAFFLDLLLPSLHLAFLRVISLDIGIVDAEGQSVASEPPILLSEREIEVLRWVTKGKGNYEIGVILELSTLTVKNHMQRIYKKLNVRNRAQAVSRCHALQLIDHSSPKGKTKASLF